MSGNYVWLFNADTAVEFFDRCSFKEAIKPEEKTAVAMEMYKEGKIECLGHTEMTPAQLAEELAKHVRVLKVEKDDADKRD